MIAPAATPASTAYSSLFPVTDDGGRSEGGEGGGQIEVCPEGLLMGKEIARRVVKSGGAALVVDYGNESLNRHTLRVSYNYYSLASQIDHCSQFS